MHLDLVRSFFAIVAHGSLNQAALRLHVAQSTLTRQLQALEHQLGGRLLERTAGGVALTTAGRTFHEGMRPVLAAFDAAVEDTRRQARGETSRLRIGCLMSVVGELLHPALAALRRAHPEVKVKLADLSPGEQLEALRRGELDLALLGGAPNLASRDFFVRRLATVPVFAVLGESHPLAARSTLRLADLRGEGFVGAKEQDLPGYNAWLLRLCRRARFRPRIVLEADGLTHGLATVLIEGAVALFPSYTRKSAGPGVVFRPLQDANAKWELFAAWPRGRTSRPVQVMLAALPERISESVAPGAATRPARRP